MTDRELLRMVLNALEATGRDQYCVVEKSINAIRARLAVIDAAGEVCKCSIRTKLVGDGCEVCNPEYANDHEDDGESDQPSESSALPQGEQCNHRDEAVRNPVITSGYMCIDCGALFAAADHDVQKVSHAQGEQCSGEIR